MNFTEPPSEAAITWMLSKTVWMAGSAACVAVAVIMRVLLRLVGGLRFAYIIALVRMGWSMRGNTPIPDYEKYSIKLRIQPATPTMAGMTIIRYRIRNGVM